MTPFERSHSKLSENQKIVEIGSTEFKLWPFKDALLNYVIEWISLCVYNYAVFERSRNPLQNR